MLLSIDPGLLEEDVGGETLSALQATQSSCVVEEQAVGRSVTWRRRRVQPGAGGEHTSEDWVEEPHVLVHVPLEGFLSMVHTYSQEVRGADTEGQVTLQSFSQSILDRSAGRIPALVVMGLEQYFRTQRKRLVTEQGGDRPMRRKQKSRVRVSRVDVEVALVHLQLTTGVQVQFLETWKEFADHINRFTKAVAETPFKRGREKADISFYMENQGSREVKVDRSGKGLLQVWSRQIQQFNRVSADMANAIVSVYPSPWLLNQAYQECSSERERQRLLAAIPVRRGEGVTSSTRKIGPQLSKRVYLQMTSTDPNLSLEIHDSLHVETCDRGDGGP
uniref:ERCC4 domain-containing protein n=2 Tax=Callorhinchus milii TaxID=7868 RepID=A0A4W3GQA5_CALMI